MVITLKVFVFVVVRRASNLLFNPSLQGTKQSVIQLMDNPAMLTPSPVMLTPLQE